MRSVKALAHVAMNITDIDRALAFYVGQLGFEEMFRLDRDDKLWIVYLRVTDTQFIELFPDATGTPGTEESRVGYNHLCLEVEDIDAAVADLKARGVAMFREKSVGADHNAQAWIADPDGNRIELMQLSPQALQVQAIRRLAAARA